MGGASAAGARCHFLLTGFWLILQDARLRPPPATDFDIRIEPMRISHVTEPLPCSWAVMK